MSKLIASYLRDSNRRRSWSLVSRQGLSLGYQVAQDQVHVDWDDLIDDLHATVTLENDRLRVVGNSDERPIFFNGISQREFMVVPGEGFVIGLTTFEFEPLLPFGESPVSDITSRTVFRQPDDLRTEMIAASHEELQLVQQFLQSQLRVDHEIQAFEETIATELRRVIRPSDQIAIIRVPDSGEALEMLAARGELSVCEELVRDAVDHYACAEHVWGTRSENASYPAPPDAAWAFCAPIFCERSRYAIYLSGARRSGGKGINSPVRLNPQQQCLVQIVADLYQQGRNVYDLIEWRDQVQEFLPRPVLHLLQRESPKVALRKKITEAAVLFCDLRGSSKFSEQNSKQLDTAWETIKGALGTMTDCIDQQNGVIGDFQGDAAMAFWGWPRSQVEDGLGEDATRACQAADRMRDKFQKKSKDSGSLANFACGIGVAAGPVVAGALGTEDQSKIGVFGPAVNLSARLESMTKQIGVSILVDDRVCKAVEQHAALGNAFATGLSHRFRCIGLIQPAGMGEAVRVHELLPEQGAMNQPLLNLFEMGRQAFEGKDWDIAGQRLSRVKEMANDSAAGFLLSAMEQMKSPPEEWDGRIVLSSK